MNRLRLIELLSSCHEDEVLLRSPEDGILDDFVIEHVEEQFDGFDSVYPASIALCPNKPGIPHYGATDEY